MYRGKLGCPRRSPPLPHRGRSHPSVGGTKTSHGCGRRPGEDPELRAVPPQSRSDAAEETKLVKSQVRREAWEAKGGEGGGGDRGTPPSPRRRRSHDLLDAGTLEAPGAALLLDLAGRAVASAPPAGQGRAGGQLHVLFVDTWWTKREVQKSERLGFLPPHPHPDPSSYLGSAGRWPVRSWSWTGSGWQ